MLLKGTIKSGQVILAQPADLPDGTEMTVRTNGHAESLGMSEDDWPTDPEGIARKIEQIMQAEPPEITPEEEADTAAWRQQIKEYTLANQDKAIEGLFE